MEKKVCAQFLFYLVFCIPLFFLQQIELLHSYLGFGLTLIFFSFLQRVDISYGWSIDFATKKKLKNVFKNLSTPHLIIILSRWLAIFEYFLSINNDYSANWQIFPFLHWICLENWIRRGAYRKWLNKKCKVWRK